MTSVPLSKKSIVYKNMKTDINNNKELEIVIEEWDQIGKGTKTVPLIQLGTSDNEVVKERKVFAYVANKLKKFFESKV